MRMIGIVVVGTLMIAVVAEGAYIVMTRNQMGDIRKQLKEVEALARRGGSASRGGDDDDRGYPRLRGGEEGSGGEGLPPEFVPAMQALDRAARQAGGLGAIAANNDGPLPLPPLLGTPEAREQLKDFVNAQIAGQAQQREQQRSERWQQAEEERTADMVQKLGLAGADAQKFTDVMASMQSQRREMFQAVQSGAKTWQDARPEMMTMRNEANTKLQALLGDEGFKKLEEMGGTGWGGDRGGGGWGGGRRRGGGPPGGPPPPAPAP